MIAIYIDKKTVRFEQEIKYTFDFIFRTLGYQYKFIRSIDDARENDIIFFYGLIEPTESEILIVAHNRAMFFIPAEPDLLQPGLLKKEQIEERIKEAKYLKDVPIVTDRDLEVPIVYYKNKNLFFGSFNFDLLGNIFFHLINYEYYSIDTRDKYHRLPDNLTCFTEFSHKPYVNVLLWLISEALKDSLTANKKKYLLKKCFWPGNEAYGAAVSHNVETLKKWTFKTLVKSALQDLLVFYQVGNLVKNALKRLKYIVTNIEEYWNFDLISGIEKELGVKSTYFWGAGTSDKADLDYVLEDQDIISEIEHQKESGFEIAMLGLGNSYKEDLLAGQKEKISTFLDTDLLGVRQDMLKYDPEITSEYHSKYNFLYDSTRAFTDRNGFKNGIGVPFYHLPDSPVRIENQFDLFRKHNCLEIPLIYSDNNLRLSQLKNISFEQARDKMASLLSLMKFYNGLITFNFSVHNFADISYNKNLFKETLANLLKDEALIMTYKETAVWWKKREAIQFEESRSEVKIYFPDQLPKLTLQLLGSYDAQPIEGPTFEQIGDLLYFKDIQTDSRARIKLIPKPEKKDNEE